MLISVYRSWVDGLSFERTGAFVATVDVPDGSALEPTANLFHYGGGLVPKVLMVPAPGDPSVRYAWGAVDIIVDAGNQGSRFRLVELDRVDRHAIVGMVGVN